MRLASLRDPAASRDSSEEDIDDPEPLPSTPPTMDDPEPFPPDSLTSDPSMRPGFKLASLRGSTARTRPLASLIPEDGRSPDEDENDPGYAPATTASGSDSEPSSPEPSSPPGIGRGRTVDPFPSPPI